MLERFIAWLLQTLLDLGYPEAAVRKMVSSNAAELIGLA